MANPMDPIGSLAVLLSRIVEHIRAIFPNLQAIYAYGSRVRGDQHPGSDIDLALLLPRRIEVSPLQIAQLQGDLESLAGFPVEISILALETQVVHCKEVVTSGHPVFVAAPGALEEFEMRVLSSYARLCEDRAPVMAAYSGGSNA